MDIIKRSWNEMAMMVCLKPGHQAYATASWIESNSSVLHSQSVNSSSCLGILTILQNEARSLQEYGKKRRSKKREKQR